MNLKTWVFASRAPFFVATIMPSLVGCAVAFYHGSFNLLLCIMLALGMMFANAGTNFINDYFDYKSGADANNQNRTQFSGGSPFLPNHMLDPKHVRDVGLVCFALGFLIAMYLTFRIGYFVLVLSSIGAFIGYFYTAPPIKLGYLGIGEIITGISLGPLTILGAYYVMTKTIAVEPIVVSIPIGILVAAILYVNEIPDYEADKNAGKNHLVVIFGKAKSVKRLPIFFILMYTSIVLGVLFKIMPIWTLIALITIPLSIKVISVANRNYDNVSQYIPAMKNTIVIYSATCVLLILGYLVPAFLR